MAGHISSEDGMHVRHRKKEQKVRNSCNACSSQKIRCSKDRPKCHRCAIKGLDCVYSMSRRTGERPRVVEANPSTIASPPTTPSRHDSVGPREGPASTATPETLPLSDLDEIGVPHDDISWMLGPTPVSDGPVDSYFDVNLPDLGPEPDCSANLRRLDPAEFLNTPPIQDVDLSFDFNPSSADGRKCVDTQPRRSESTASTQTSSATSPKQTKLDLRRKIHDCTSEALALVADFHVAARGCLTAAKDGASRLDLEYSSTFDTYDVETVLSRNREAMKKLNAILNCQCSLSQEVLVTVYLAVGKCIIWYAAILGDDGTPGDQSHSALMGRITAKPVFMGTYCLDTQTQRIVGAHVVLTQLREHVAPLVKRLVCRHSSTGGETTMSSRPPSPTTLSTLSLIECHHLGLQEQLTRLSARANSIKQG